MVFQGGQLGSGGFSPPSAGGDTKPSGGGKKIVKVGGKVVAIQQPGETIEQAIARGTGAASSSVPSAPAPTASTSEVRPQITVQQAFARIRGEDPGQFRGTTQGEVRQEKKKRAATALLLGGRLEPTRRGFTVAETTPTKLFGLRERGRQAKRQFRITVKEEGVPRAGVEATRVFFAGPTGRLSQRFSERFQPATPEQRGIARSEFITQREGGATIKEAERAGFEKVFPEGSPARREFVGRSLAAAPLRGLGVAATEKRVGGDPTGLRVGVFGAELAPLVLPFAAEKAVLGLSRTRTVQRVAKKGTQLAASKFPTQARTRAVLATETGQVTEGGFVGEQFGGELVTVVSRRPAFESSLFQKPAQVFTGLGERVRVVRPKGFITRGLQVETLGKGESTAFKGAGTIAEIRGRKAQERALTQFRTEGIVTRTPQETLSLTKSRVPGGKETPALGKEIAKISGEVRTPVAGRLDVERIETFSQIGGVSGELGAGRETGSFVTRITTQRLTKKPTDLGLGRTQAKSQFELAKEQREGIKAGTIESPFVTAQKQKEFFPEFASRKPKGLKLTTQEKAVTEVTAAFQQQTVKLAKDAPKGIRLSKATAPSPFAGKGLFERTDEVAGPAQVAAPSQLGGALQSRPISPQRIQVSQTGKTAKRLISAPTRAVLLTTRTAARGGLGIKQRAIPQSRLVLGTTQTLVTAQAQAQLGDTPQVPVLKQFERTAVVQRFGTGVARTPGNIFRGAFPPLIPILQAGGGEPFGRVRKVKAARGKRRVSPSLIGTQFPQKFKPITVKAARARIPTGVGIRPLIKGGDIGSPSRII